MEFKGGESPAQPDGPPFPRSTVFRNVSKLLFVVAELLSLASQTFHSSAPSCADRLAIARMQRQGAADGVAFWNLGWVTEVYPTLFLRLHPLRTSRVSQLG
jgi:hypothetical protein